MMSRNDELKNSTREGANAGFVNGLTNGLTNGNGKINGNSKINGLVNGKNGNNKQNRGIMRTVRGRMGVWTVIGVVLLLIFGAFAFSTHLFGGMNWSGINKYVDVDNYAVNNLNVNITKFAFHQENGNFYFYIEFNGKFSESNLYKNLAYIFIQSGSSITGYETGYINANYLIKIEGFSGAVTGSFMTYNGTGHDWNWVTTGGVIVEEKDNAVEGNIATTFSNDAKIILVAQNKYVQDITPVVGIEKTALVVIQSYSGDTMNIRLIPLYGAVKINDISVKTTSNVEITNPSVLKSVGEISSPKTITLDIQATSGSAKVWINDVSSDAFTTTIWGYGYRKYIGTPKGIVIDGIFDDWKNIPKYSSTSPVENPNIDVESYANTTYSGNNYFYLSVVGSMLNGNIAPEMEKTKPSGGGAGGGKPAPKYPYDYAEIDFTTNNGKSHKIEIWGYNGNVIGITLDGKPVGNSVKVGVGKDGKYGALEVELTGGYSIKSYRISMTDWNGLHSIAMKSNTTTPELSPTLAVPLIFIAAIPVILRHRKE